MTPAASPKPAVRRRMTADARREQLLEAALAEFGRRGFHSTQMDHVAARAGVSKALLYQHFPSKDDLFAEVTGRIVDLYVERLPAILDAATEPLVAWRGAVSLLVEVVEAQPDSWALVARYLADPELGAPLRAMRQGLYDALADLLVGFYAGPAVPADLVRATAEQTVPLLVGALQGLLSWWVEHPEVPRAQVEQRAVEFGWLGLDRLRHGEGLDNSN